MSTVAVIDYGMGNLHSIAKALQHVSSDTKILVTSDPEKICSASRVVFPGVGAIRDCMAALHRYQLIGVLTDVAKTKPLLGICLGLQALLDSSDESGQTQCMGIFPGEVVHFPESLVGVDGVSLKIPHMGWNQVYQREPHPLWKDIPQYSRFYFVHSYFAELKEINHVMATTDYPDPFACAIGRGNIFAVQFHPEKSQQVGLRFLSNFLDWDGGMGLGGIKKGKMIEGNPCY